MGPRIGACSWSLGVRTVDELVAALRAIGVDAVQLALDPVREGAWKPARLQRALDAAGIEARSGMMGTRGEDYSSLESIRRTGGVRPDEHWNANRRAATGNAKAARELGIELVTLHAGFLPEDAGDPERAVLIERLREVVDRFGEHGVRVAFETGQETADTLLGVLRDLERASAGVNFDPANMLLYDMGDPVAALDALAPFVHQVHLKDARRTQAPGSWGAEVPLGEGEVDWKGFFRVLRARGVECDLMIEREAGDDRVGDMRRARAVAERHLAPYGPVARAPRPAEDAAEGAPQPKGRRG